MNAKLTAAAVLFSSLLAGSAFADPHHARPTYAPPAPSYAAPAYSAPSYHPAAAPVVTVSWGGDEDGDRGWGRGEHWRHEAWERFQREQVERCRAEDNYLASERADYIARYGWDARAMAWLDQHQADERAQFQASQQMREQEFRNRLAMMDRGRHGWRHGDRDERGDWD